VRAHTVTATAAQVFVRCGLSASLPQ